MSSDKNNTLSSWIESIIREFLNDPFENMLWPGGPEKARATALVSFSQGHAALAPSLPGPGIHQASPSLKDMGEACARPGFPVNQGSLSFQFRSALNFRFFLKNPHGEKLAQGELV